MNLSIRIPYTSVFSDKISDPQASLSISSDKFVTVTIDKYNIDYIITTLFQYSNVAYDSIDLWNKKISILNSNITNTFVDSISKSALELKLLAINDNSLVDVSRKVSNLHNTLRASNTDKKYLVSTKLKLHPNVFSFSSYPDPISRKIIEDQFDFYSKSIEFINQDSNTTISPLFFPYPNTFVFISKNLVLSWDSITLIYDNVQQLTSLINFIDSIDVFTSELYKKKFLKESLELLKTNYCKVITIPIQTNQVNYSILKQKYNCKINSEHLLILELANIYSSVTTDRHFYLLPTNNEVKYNLQTFSTFDRTKEVTNALNSIICTPKFIPLPKQKILRIRPLNIVEESITLTDRFVFFSNCTSAYNLANKILNPIIKTKYFNKLTISQKQADIKNRFETFYTNNPVSLSIQQYLYTNNLGNLQNIRAKYAPLVRYLDKPFTQLHNHTHILENYYSKFNSISEYDSISSKVYRDPTGDFNKSKDVTSIPIIKIINDSIPPSINFLDNFSKENINFSIFANYYLRSLVILRHLIGKAEFDSIFQTRTTYINSIRGLKGNIEPDFIYASIHFIIPRKVYETIIGSISYRTFGDYVIDPLLSNNVIEIHKGYASSDVLTITSQDCSKFSKLAITL